MATISIGNAVQFGWKTTLNHFIYILSLQAIVFGVTVLPQMFDFLYRMGVRNADADQSSPVFALVGALLMLVGLAASLLSSYLEFGIKRIFLKSVTAVPTGYADLKSSFLQYVYYMLAAFLYGLMAMIGYLFLIIPGIIVTLMFQFYPYIMIEKNVGPLLALQESMDLTRGAKWDLFVFGLALFGINILGVLALGLGLLITIPLSGLACAHVYTQLRNRHAAFPHPTPAPTV